MGVGRGEHNFAEKNVFASLVNEVNFKKGKDLLLLPFRVVERKQEITVVAQPNRKYDEILA